MMEISENSENSEGSECSEYSDGSDSSDSSDGSDESGIGVVCEKFLSGVIGWEIGGCTDFGGFWLNFYEKKL